MVVASEGMQTADGRFVADAGGGKDAFGHTQLGGVASLLAGRVKDKLGSRCTGPCPTTCSARRGTWRRRPTSSRRRRSGKPRCEFALKGMNAVMPVIVRTADSPYRWKIEAAPLAKIANHEKKMPAGFIRKDGYGITAAARRYLRAADPRRGAAAVRARWAAEVRRR